MTNLEMQKLQRGDLVKLQYDLDPALEDGIIIKVGGTRCVIFGEDPEVGGFYGVFSADKIISIVKSHGSAGTLANKVRSFIADVAGVV